MTETSTPRSAELTLLVAGESSATRSARATLDTLIGDGLAEASHVRVIDILQQPDYALRYRVYFTPSLIVETSTATTTIVGDLHELDEVRSLLAAA
ncbi:circadian clock KaiB family protein [Agreia sp. Leaf210]|uniref:circadian clock KaiB family protein n=1 Tax=Agreia sp. Leaf210 TaxID=1735682 RepID=UPI0007016680|nr:circadian clock KaiB family protein [Agreia sp. Leaf210]KQM57555.1 hypothetical protein ASE64_15465 [Agreia sp. Leaf210]